MNTLFNKQPVNKQQGLSALTFKELVHSNYNKKTSRCLLKGRNLTVMFNDINHGAEPRST